MAGFSITRRIEAPVDAVFAVFSDFAHAAERIDGIQRLEVLTDGPIGVGTRFRETRVMYGKEAIEELEITAFEPNHSYRVECTSHGTHFTSLFRFEPDREATRVVVRFDTQAISLAAKLFSPLAGLMVKTVRTCVTADIDDLERHLQATA